MAQRATITNYAEAVEIVKEMNLGENDNAPVDLRFHGREALKKVLREKMDNRIDCYLSGVALRGESDRRNGSYTRNLLTAMGSIELEVSRCRKFSALSVINAYKRRTSDIDH
ncbi:MAG: transposase, partial [Nitrospinae bacterium]|nr:transposase [Nitrospinota bacterium]MBI3794339.1 transposase [Nitrospinota bacterium]